MDRNIANCIVDDGAVTSMMIIYYYRWIDGIVRLFIEESSGVGENYGSIDTLSLSLSTNKFEELIFMHMMICMFFESAQLLLLLILPTI